MKLQTGQEFYKFRTAWPCAVSEGKMEGKKLGGKQGEDQVERALWAIVGRKTAFIISVRQAPEEETHSFTEPFVEYLL